MVLRRCLAIVQRALAGPASRQELLASVYATEGEDAYSGVQGSALSRRFEKDLARIRENLFVELRYDQKAGYYVIQSADLPLCNLPDHDLHTLAFLLETFRNGTPHSDRVHRLINTLLSFFSPERRQLVSRFRSGPEIDLIQRDNDPVDSAVYQTVQEAWRTRRRLCFDYLGSSYQDGIPRQHIVEPWDFYFDPARRHYYLRAWCLWRDHSDGPSEPRAYRHYRLGRIRPGTAEVLPEKLSLMGRTAPRFAAVYLLSPEVSRTGVSRQDGLLPDPEVTWQPDGWAEVRGQTEDLFLLSRNLLYYGANCRVTGGPQLLREMQQLVAALATQYLSRLPE